MLLKIEKVVNKNVNVTMIVMARRITRMVDGEIIPTRSVIIAFEDELPREVFVHLRRYRV